MARKVIKNEVDRIMKGVDKSSMFPGHKEKPRTRVGKIGNMEYVAHKGSDGSFMGTGVDTKKGRKITKDGDISKTTKTGKIGGKSYKAEKVKWRGDKTPSTTVEIGKVTNKGQNPRPKHEKFTSGFDGTVSKFKSEKSPSRAVGLTTVPIKKAPIKKSKKKSKKK